MLKTRNFGFVVLILCVLTVTFAGESFAAGDVVSPVIDRILAKKELVVGTAGTMPPLNMTTKDGKIIGYEPDLAAIFAQGMGVKLTMKPMRFSDLLPALQAGKVDMILSGMTMTPKRNLTVAFAGPYFPSGKSILTKQANAVSMNSIEKMNKPDNTLVALKGSTSEEFARKVIPNAKLLLGEDYGQAIEMVKNGKAQVLVADFPICLYSSLRFVNEGLVTLDKPLTYEPIGVALSGSDLLLVNWVQNVLGSLEKTGEMDRLLQKWFKESSWMNQLP